MSGGRFNYVQYRITQAADEVEQYIRRCESDETDEYGYKPDYSAETLAKFRECEKTLRRAGEMLQRVDWLASGDDGEERFHKRWFVLWRFTETANAERSGRPHCELSSKPTV